MINIYDEKDPIVVISDDSYAYGGSPNSGSLPSSYSGESSGSSSPLTRKLEIQEDPLAPRESFFDKNKTLLKIAAFALTSATFVGSSCFYVKETFGKNGKKDITVLTFCSLVNGATIPAFYHLIDTGFDWKFFLQNLNRKFNAWSYEALFTFSQLYLNLTPQKAKEICRLPFIWFLGVLFTKDLLRIFSMDKADLDNNTLLDDEPIPTLGFDTRNRSLGAKFWFTSQALTSIASTTLYFLYFDELNKWGPYGKIGLYQDFLSLYTGSVWGQLIARWADNKRDSLEKGHVTYFDDKPFLDSENANKEIENKGFQHYLNLNPIKSMTQLKILRTAKTIFLLVGPILVSACLSINTHPNSYRDYFATLFVGGYYGASLEVALKEFENGRPIKRSESSSSSSENQIPEAKMTKIKISTRRREDFPAIVDRNFRLDRSLHTFQAFQPSLVSQIPATESTSSAATDQIPAMESISSTTDQIPAIEEDFSTAVQIPAIESISLTTDQIPITERNFSTSAQISESNRIFLTTKKVKKLAEKYLPSVGFFAGLVAYMLYAAVTSDSRADYAIVVLLITAIFSFVLTDRIAANYVPQRINPEDSLWRQFIVRLINEGAFRALFAQTSWTIGYQFLATKLDIGDEHLDQDLIPLYVLALITWFFWGINVGNNRATSLEEPRNSFSLFTPTLTSTEIAKGLAENLGI